MTSRFALKLAVSITALAAGTGALLPALATTMSGGSRTASARPSPLQPRPETGTIIGTVLDRRGAPLAHLCVTAQSARSAVSAGRAVVTSPTGMFTIAGLPAGAYDLSYRKCTTHGLISWPGSAAQQPMTVLGAHGPSRGYVTAGYLTMLSPVRITAIPAASRMPVRPEERFVKLTARPVTTRVSKVTSHIDIVLKAGAVARGKVTDKATGKPLSGICVFIDEGDAFTETKADGSYSVDQIQPSRSEVDFVNCDNPGSFAPQSYNGQLDSAAANRVVFRGGRVTGHLNAAMTPGGTISGTLTLTSGKRLSNVCAQAIYTGDVAVDGQDAIGEDGFFGESLKGRYSIANLPAGQFQVAFSACDVGPSIADQWYLDQTQPGKADRINVSPGSRVSHIDAVLQKAGSISGKITAASSANPIVCVTATSKSIGLMKSGLLFFGTGYQVGGLVPGRYTVEFQPCGDENLATQWYDHAGSSAKAKAVAVSAGRTTGSVSAHLARGGSITGRVISKKTGKPLTNVCVNAEGRSQTFFGFGATNSSGRYRVTGLNTGTYRLTFSSCGGTGLRPIVSAHVRAVTGRDVTGPDVAMSAQRRGAMTGTVTSGAPHPTGTAGVCVDAIPVAPRDNGAFEDVATTDRGGFYRMSGLVAGRYRVFFGNPACDTDPGGLAPQWFDAKSSPKTATVITIRPGGTVHSISAVLKPDGWITGTVNGPAPSAKALPGTCVVASPVVGHQAPMLAMSASGGHYKLGPLTPGRYLVTFSAGCGTSGIATQWWHDAHSAAEATPVLVKVGATHSGIDATMKLAG